MNDARRKELNKAIDKVTAIKAAAEALAAPVPLYRRTIYAETHPAPQPTDEPVGPYG